MCSQVQIAWPSGTTDVYRDVPVNTTLDAIEGRSPSTAESGDCGCRSTLVADVSKVGESVFQTHVQAGIEAYHRADYEAAAKAFEAAIPLRPDEPTSYRYLGRSLLAAGASLGGGNYVVQQLAEAMPDAYFLDRQGSGYEASELFGLAQLLYREAVRLDPAFASARFNLGRTWLEAGETARGIEEIREAIRLHPEFAEAHETLGLAYLEQSEWEAAIRHLERALTFNPGLDPGASPSRAALYGTRPDGCGD